MPNTVEVIGSTRNTVELTSQEPVSLTVLATSPNQLVVVKTEGPQGKAGEAGPPGLDGTQGAINTAPDFDSSTLIDGGALIWNASTSKWVASIAASEITDGGNF